MDEPTPIKPSVTLNVYGQEYKVPEEDIDRFHSGYEEWLADGEPRKTFDYSSNGHTYVIRFDAISVIVIGPSKITTRKISHEEWAKR